MSLILVPLDFSDCAPNVMAEAVRFARAFSARLVLLHASDPPRGLPLTAMVQPPTGGPPRTVSSLLRDDAEAHLAPLLDQARGEGVRADGLVVFGRTSQAILDAAHDQGATMILMGTHGRTGLARVTMGSVAEEVIRHADVPVVVVRTKHHDGCAARSCASCELGRSEVEQAISAEDVG